ncbi:hypothetical protein PK28_05275 [Hymenobacter sp. DG25B]|uniref:hypothetical protein n=1 Tax=Hymenobacter sp. DG25B TaxID=1385664 RepID=UPI000540A7C4|nr:hypothetical protein [Hymenobacter sp. DG25B]AIZ63246.1 hypothetical protein PK28_05275 [Hymenobacter sp. DG25B]
MKEAISFFKKNRGKALLSFLGFCLFAFAFSKATHLYIITQTPDVIQNAVNNAKVSGRILSRTGDIFSEEYSFEKQNLERDSLQFSIKLKGEKAAVLIEGVARKQSNNDWNIFRSDTIFTDN